MGSPTGGGKWANWMAESVNITDLNASVARASSFGGGGV